MGPFQLPQAAWVSPREWIRNPSWINVFLSGRVPDELREVYNIGTSEPSGDESQPTVSVAVPRGAASGAPGSLIGRHFAPPTNPPGELAPFRAVEGRTPVVGAPVVAEEVQVILIPFEVYSIVATSSGHASSQPSELVQGLQNRRNAQSGNLAQTTCIFRCSSLDCGSGHGNVRTGNPVPLLWLSLNLLNCNSKPPAMDRKRLARPFETSTPFRNES